jgi:hypothetical protein
MDSPWIAALFALFVWWFSTGAILVVVKRADLAGGSAHLTAVLAGLPLLGLGWYGLVATMGSATVGNVYGAFLSALAIWALLGRRIADRADAEAREGATKTFRPREAEIRDLEHLGLAETAAQHVARREVAVDDAHAMNGGDPRAQTANGMGCPYRIERVLGLVHRVDDAVLERRSLDATVHVLERNPRRLPTTDHRTAGVDETHHERTRWHPLVQATERDGFLLSHQLR